MILGKNIRKLVLLQGAAILVCGATAAQAGNLGVNLNINLGEPQRQVVVAPAPVYVPPPPPVYAPPMEAIRIEDDIQFVYPDALGFYVAVGVPYDLFYMQNSYYLFRDGRWLRAPSSRGPWVVQRYRELPQGLRRYKIERIRDYRTREYVNYNRDRDHYRGKHFRSEKEHAKEQHREVREQRKEEHQMEKEQRREDKHFDKEQRREEKHHDKEERRERKEDR